jgi:hypothetical protein
MMASLVDVRTTAYGRRMTTLQDNSSMQTLMFVQAELEFLKSLWGLGTE